MTRPALAFFTRVLDAEPPRLRYQRAIEQLAWADQLGFDSGWVAQHHFGETEGGMPSPFVFLASVAASTATIRLGTGIITLPLEDPVRVAEDAAVADALSGGRIEIGVGSGGTPTAFETFGVSAADKHAVFASKLRTLDAALSGSELAGGNRLYPPGSALADRLWIATFNRTLATQAGAESRGLQLSRTQPRPEDAPDQPLWDVQNPLIDAYLTALPASSTPRISVARSLFVADDADDARRRAVAAYRRHPIVRATLGTDASNLSDHELLRRLDVHVGSVDDVLESLSKDTALTRATQVSFQVHSIDPPHELILRSTELLATRVAPQLGWGIRIGRV